MEDDSLSLLLSNAHVHQVPVYSISICCCCFILLSGKVLISSSLKTKDLQGTVHAPTLSHSHAHGTSEAEMNFNYLRAVVQLVIQSYTVRTKIIVSPGIFLLQPFVLKTFFPVLR